MHSRLGDPGPMGLSMFGFTLAALGFAELVAPEDAIPAVIFGILVTGIIQVACAVIELMRGETFLGTIFGTFAAWLIGFYLILTHPELGNPHSQGLYVLVLLGPIAYLAVIAFLYAGNALKLAFVAVFLTALTLGIGLYRESETWLDWAGIFAFIGAAPVWWIAFDRVNKAIRAEVAGAAPGEAPEPDVVTAPKRAQPA